MCINIMSIVIRHACLVENFLHVNEVHNSTLGRFKWQSFFTGEISKYSDVRVK